MYFMRYFFILILGSLIEAKEIAIYSTADVFKPFTRDNVLEVVIDSAQNLMWQDNNAVGAQTYDWKDAQRYCQTLSHGAFEDWRTPVKNELLSIVDRMQEDVKIPTVFIHRTPTWYWSASLYLADEKHAWYVDFGSGGVFDYFDSKELDVRCVRSVDTPTASLTPQEAPLLLSENATLSQTIQALLLAKIATLPLKPQPPLLIKDMFETVDEFHARSILEEDNYHLALQEYEKSVLPKVKTLRERSLKDALELIYGRPIVHSLEYNAETMYFNAEITFDVKHDFSSQKVTFMVPREAAKSLYESRDLLQPKAIFEYDDASVVLKRIEIPFDGEWYEVQWQNFDLNSTMTSITFDIDTPATDTPIEDNVTAMEANTTRLDD